jgi:hypothetical protein
MAFRAKNPLSEKKYISPRDPDPENPTIAIFKGLDYKMHSKLKDELLQYKTSSANPTDSADVKCNVNSLNIEAVRYGLVDLANLIDHEGNIVEFKTKKEARFGKNYDVVVDQIIALLHTVGLIDEYAKEIMELTTLSSSEKKS